MKDDQTEKLIHMNQRLLLLLGYATSFVMSYKDSPYTDTKQDEKIDWFLKSVENVVYLDKPLEKMP